MNKSDIVRIKVGDKLRFITAPYFYDEYISNTKKRSAWLIGAIDLIAQKVITVKLTLSPFSSIKEFCKKGMDPVDIDLDFKSFDVKGWSIDFTYRKLTDSELEMKNSFNVKELEEYIDKVSKFQKAFL